ncbi:glycosyltransferase family 9 protein [Stenotrophomonas cyclobalanopsidis]|uniref:glycosyltransferase family 9 protein n=1 Tax=Stenotrophomonas cyclobalanopsidis TaxID=2771362 RepID=UPI002FDB2684
MIFNLQGLHLGDALLAMPAMRSGDSVAIGEQHRVPGAPVAWLDAGAGMVPSPRGHRTSAWLDATGREPVRHQLLPSVDRDLLVIAPDVRLPRKRWHGWDELGRRLPAAVWVTASIARAAWMHLLNRAHTVVCPDTGTAHMADALGCPRVVGLYGQDFEQFAPYWCRDYCVSRDGMARITVDDVMGAVRG